MLYVITPGTENHTLSLVASAHWAVWWTATRPAPFRFSSPSPGLITAARNEKQVSSRVENLSAIQSPCLVVATPGFRATSMLPCRRCAGVRRSICP